MWRLGRRGLGEGAGDALLESTMPDYQSWEFVLRVYAKHPDAALSLAEELAQLKQFLQEGTEGIPKALEQLDEAIKALHPHTDFYRLGERFYQQRIFGKLQTNHENILRELGVKI